MNPFTYAYPVKTYFGKGAAAQSLPGELARVRTQCTAGLRRRFHQAEWCLYRIDPAAGSRRKDDCGFFRNHVQPYLRKVQEGARLAREKKIDFILAVGGGSVIDCCKIVSAQALLDEDIWDYEYSKKQVPSQFIPMGAVVTAFGTGAE